MFKFERSCPIQSEMIQYSMSNQQKNVLRKVTKDKMNTPIAKTVASIKKVMEKCLNHTRYVKLAKTKLCIKQKLFDATTFHFFSVQSTSAVSMDGNLHEKVSSFPKPSRCTPLPLIQKHISKRDFKSSLVNRFSCLLCRRIVTLSCIVRKVWILRENLLYCLHFLNSFSD